MTTTIIMIIIKENMGRKLHRDYTVQCLFLEGLANARVVNVYDNEFTV